MSPRLLTPIVGKTVSVYFDRQEVEWAQIRLHGVEEFRRWMFSEAARIIGFRPGDGEVEWGPGGVILSQELYTGEEADDDR